MSIFIDGMKMPKSCSRCFCMASCRLWKNIMHPEFNRHRNCPLVPVPTPHGRLIDVKSLENMHFTECMYDAESKLFVPFVEVASAIFDAPTIIPAEEGKT